MQAQGHLKTFVPCTTQVCIPQESGSFAQIPLTSLLPPFSSPGWSLFLLQELTR